MTLKAIHDYKTGAAEVREMTPKEEAEYAATIAADQAAAEQRALAVPRDLGAELNALDARVVQLEARG